MNCSRCGLDTEDDSENDIVFCDRVGCFRAYHLLCLEPPIQSLASAGFKDEDEWFCWKCETLDDILDHLNDALGTSYIETNLFPELESGPQSLIDAYYDDDDDEEDESFNPDDTEGSDAVDSEEEAGEGNRSSEAKVTEAMHDVYGPDKNHDDDDGGDDDDDDSGDDSEDVSVDTSVSDDEIRGLVEVTQTRTQTWD